VKTNETESSKASQVISADMKLVRSWTKAKAPKLKESLENDANKENENYFILNPICDRPASWSDALWQTDWTVDYRFPKKNIRLSDHQFSKTIDVWAI